MSTQSIPVSPMTIPPFSLASACSSLVEKLKPIPPANMKAVLLALDPFFDQLRAAHCEVDGFDVDELGEEVKNLLAFHREAVSNDAEKSFDCFFSDFAAVIEISICFLNERLATPSADEAQNELYRIGSGLGMDVFSGNYFGQAPLKVHISPDPISFYFETSTMRDIYDKWSRVQAEKKGQVN
jgi:hypothetical protein